MPELTIPVTHTKLWRMLAKEDAWLGGDWDSRSARGIATMERHQAKRRAIVAAIGDHHAEPIPEHPWSPDGVIVCRVCRKPVRTAYDGRYAIHATV